ncbi:hypothetical protein FJZ31_14665 [Candidatus Poribacteria bacterium]|nr:hypothetical protein [Candidatus Poribacteria bacterium]
MKCRLLTMLFIVFSFFTILGCGSDEEEHNTAPVINSFKASSAGVGAGSQVTLIVLAMDAEKDPLTYTYQPSAGTIRGTGDRVTWIAPATEGSYVIEVNVSDGELSAKSFIVIPVVSPIIEAERIVYQVELGEFNSQIYMMEPDGKNQIQLTHQGANYEPSLSPNGKMIAFANDDGLNVMNADGTAARWLLNPDHISGISWSLDSSKLLLCVGSFNSDIYIFALDGSNFQKIILPQKDGLILDAAWSADGKKIILAMGPLLQYEIYTMNSDGSNMMRLTDFTPDALCAEPSWSPDGKQILFVLRDLETRTGYVMTMSNDGNNIQRLVKGEDPAWSPDGLRIVYAAEDEEGDFEIYTIGVNGIGKKQLTSNFLDDRDPFWGIAKIGGVNQIATAHPTPPLEK